MEPENNHLNKRLCVKKFEDISENRVNSVNDGEEAGPSVDEKPQRLPPMLMGQPMVQLPPYRVPIPQARQSDWGIPLNSNLPVTPSLYIKRARESPSGQIDVQDCHTVAHHGVFPSTNHPDYVQHHSHQGQGPMYPLNLSFSSPHSVGSNTAMFPTSSSGRLREEIFPNHRVISSGFRTLGPEQMHHGHQDLRPLSRQNLGVLGPLSVESNTVMFPISSSGSLNPTGNFRRGDINEDHTYGHDCCCKRMRKDFDVEIAILNQTVYRLQEQLKSVISERDFLIRRCELLQGGGVSGGLATPGQSNPTSSTELGNWR